MILCILLAVIAGAVMLWIIRPLIGLEGGLLAEEHAARVQGYRAALAALEADRAQAAIPAGEAMMERAALGRALLAETSAAAEPQAAKRLPRWAAFAMAGALPLLGLGIYFVTGMSEGRSSLMAYTERAETESLQRQLAEALKRRPNDPQGHRFMAMTEAALGHYAAAAHHYGEALAYGERSSELLTLYGEMLALAAGKAVPEALAAFDEALARDSQNIRARIARGEGRMALKDFAGAVEDLKAVLALVQPGSPWAEALSSRIAQAEHAMKGSRSRPEEGAAQAAMIRGMVDRLAARLEANPMDLAGWGRLVHSYAVLGEREKAEAALSRARQLFAGDERAKPVLDAAERELRGLR